jgi:hypothetical protein
MPSGCVVNALADSALQRGVIRLHVWPTLQRCGGYKRCTRWDPIVSNVTRSAFTKGTSKCRQIEQVDIKSDALIAACRNSDDGIEKIKVVPFRTVDQ